MLIQQPNLKKNVSHIINPSVTTNELSSYEKLLYWAAIIESSDDAIISKSPEGIITSWNKGAEKLYGYTAQEVIGKPVSIIMPKGKESDFSYMMSQFLAGKRIDHYATQRQRKDGRIIDVSITVSPIKDATGKIIGASKIARDITAQVEEERRKEDFISTASHELKTPLTSQQVYGKLLERLIEKNDDSEYLPLIQKMNKQTKKLIKLTEDLIELSRTEKGKLEMDMEPFDFDDLVQEIVENSRMISNHKIEITSTVNQSIVGDRERIGQVLTNLILNAVKYSPRAEQVIVNTNVIDNELQVSIRDFGIGIPKEYHEKIFERFFRVYGEDEKTFPGMGIGLYLSKEIVTRHGGTIWLESDSNKGSTFTFSLPLG